MSDEKTEGTTSYTSGVTVTPGSFRPTFKPQITAGDVVVSRNSLGVTLERVLTGYYDLSNDKDREYIRWLIERAKKDSVIEIGRPEGWAVSIHVSGTKHVTPGAPWIVLVRKEGES